MDLFACIWRRKVTREDAVKLQNQEKFDLFFEISSKENIDVDRVTNQSWDSLHILVDILL